jgi:predicted negative regulator of RcsB-dependent stress response
MSGEVGKISKGELRDDEFVDWVMAAVDYVREHYRVFVAVLAVVVLAGVGVQYVLKSQERARAQAAGRLGEALILQAEGQGDEAQRAIDDVLQRFAGTPAAGQAALMVANRHFDAGDYDEARTMYGRYLADYGDESPALSFAAKSGLAATLEAEGQVEPAAAAYRTLAEEYRGSFQAALALWEAAKCYERLGADPKRREVLEQIVRDHDQLPLAAKARAALAAM